MLMLPANEQKFQHQPIRCLHGKDGKSLIFCAQL